MEFTSVFNAIYSELNAVNEKFRALFHVNTCRDIHDIMPHVTLNAIRPSK